MLVENEMLRNHRACLGAVKADGPSLLVLCPHRSDTYVPVSHLDPAFRQSAQVPRRGPSARCQEAAGFTFPNNPNAAPHCTPAM